METEIVVVLIGGCSVLLGTLLGAFIGYFLWRKQFEFQVKFEILRGAARALGMFFEDATNPRIQERQVVGTIRRDIEMRPETSQEITAQKLLIAGKFGDVLANEFHATIDLTHNWRNAGEGNEFIERSGVLLKKMLERI